MKIRFLMISVAVLMPAGQGVFGIENLAGRTTVPQSSLRSGTISNPTSDYYNNQLNGNLIVTGNIDQGRHFRGLVPYRATSEFTEPLGSSSLNSFLRDSARTYYPDLPPGVAHPYYLPSQTVTTLGQPGQSSLQLLHDQLEQQTRQFFRAASTTTEDQPLISPLKTYRKGRPLSMELDELEELISVPPVQPQAIAEAEKSTLENKMEELASRLLQEVDAAGKLQEKLQDESFKPTAQRTQDYKVGQSEKLSEKDAAEEDAAAEKPPAEQKSPVDIYMQMERQIEEELQKRLEQMKDEAKEEDIEQQKPQLGPESDKDSTSDSDHRRQILYDHFLKDKSAEQEEASWQNLIAKEFFLKKRDKRTVPSGRYGAYRSFDDLADAKFNEYLRAAGEYMKQGEYYRAADAWTLASTYKPNNPIAYAGKAHALFVAGEYMSSAYFLSRAIELFPGYIQLELKLETIITDKDALEKRIADLGKWATTTGSGELFFLLSYVYYRINNLELAQDAIEITLDKMPDSAAVIILKNAIFKAIGRSQ
jgi:hypothetical protein